MNKSEIARRMNCDRRTVDRYINNPTARVSTREYTSELEPFKETIIKRHSAILLLMPDLSLLHAEPIVRKQKEKLSLWRISLQD